MSDAVPQLPETYDALVFGDEDASSVTIPLSGSDFQTSVATFTIITKLPAHGVLKDGLGKGLVIFDPCLSHQSRIGR